MDNERHLDIEELKAVKKKICTLDQKHQKEQLKRISPYSKDITAYINSCDELQLYISLHLRESYLTRPTLVMDIEPDLWIESEKATNLELMARGRPPYIYDTPEGRIELHHIGQNYDAPFVELTQDEHDRNSQILHTSKQASWRNNKKLVKSFESERSAYWIKRSQGEYTIDEIPETTAMEVAPESRKDYLAELRDICEEIYKQSEIDDLDYLSDLAKSYAMMRRIGALSMGEFLKNERFEQNIDIHCTSCSASNCVHYGTYYGQGENIQRYKCKKCGKVFTATAQTLLSGSSFSFKDWLKFIDCLYNGFTIGQIAKNCNISENTVMDNRTKLFYVLKLLNDRVMLQGNIAIDETFEPVSFKGNHSQQEGFVMPRAAHGRGGENHAKGITDNLVCIVCAVDDCGNSVCKVAGTGNSSGAKLKYVLEPHIGGDVICFYSDKSNAIRNFAKRCDCKIKQEKLLVKGTKQAENVNISHESFVVNRYIQVANSYQSRMKRFLRRFFGISTKYLSGYLYLFAWKERNKDREDIEVYKELLRTMAEPNNYLSAKEIMEEGHLPDAIDINHKYKKNVYVLSERDRKIREMYSEGFTLERIAKQVGTTKQNVSLRIKRMNKEGYICTRARDIPEEESIAAAPHKKLKRKVLDTLIRDYQIYEAKLQWKGDSQAFYQKMSADYGISVQRVKNVIALIKRYIELKKEIAIYENIDYKTLEVVYRNVFSDYNAILDANPGIYKEECYKRLSEKYGFKPKNITRIIQIMTTELPDEYFGKKRKLSTVETYNRDKALFIDFLRWTGERSDFCRHASEKYGISYYNVQTILKYCLYADPKRFEIV